MSDIELAVRWSRKLESLLEDRLGAQGRGLHEKTSSVEDRLPEALVRELRFIATIRNKVVHDDACEIDDRDGFERACHSAETQLSALGGVPAPVAPVAPVAEVRPTARTRAASLWTRAPAYLKAATVIGGVLLCWRVIAVVIAHPFVFLLGFALLIIFLMGNRKHRMK